MNVAAPVVLALLLTAPPAPDPVLTPGEVRTGVTRAQSCAIKWGTDERAVTSAMRRQVYREYGYPLGNADPRCPCVVDHRVPRELLGADKLANLWVQTAKNARTKDRLENLIHRLMCAGKLTLAEAQGVFLGDWREGYHSYFGQDP